jgi:hypothetical protein
VVTARFDIGAVVRSLPKRWRALEGRVERTLVRVQAGSSRVLAARAWRPRWWGRALAWWAASPIRSAIGWWLAALDGCLERAHARLPRWWPERLTSVLLVAGLLALDVEAWRWLPW